MIPRISIVVPVYKVEERLRSCLDSLLGQTLDALEIVCVDDGSPDTCPAILDEYANKDARVKVVHRTNGGLSAARNSGWTVASGEYLLFCDSDDEYDETMCERLLASVESSGADLGRCGVQVIGLTKYGKRDFVKGDYFDCRYHGFGLPLTDQIVFDTDVCVWNKIYRRNLVERYGIRFPEGMVHEDDAFYLQYCSVAKSISFVDEKLYRYILREGSIMAGARSVASAEDYLRVMEYVYEFLSLRIGISERRMHFFVVQYVLHFIVAQGDCPEDGKSRLFARASVFLSRITAVNWVREDPWILHLTRKILSRQIIGTHRRRIGSVTWLKVVERPERHEIRFLGIPLYRRKRVLG